MEEKRLLKIESSIGSKGIASQISFRDEHSDLTTYLIGMPPP